MSVYVDDMRESATVGGIRAHWSHLSADTRDELLVFAHKLGVKPSRGQHWDSPLFHLPVMDSQRQRAIRLGAAPVSPYELVKRRLGRAA